MKAEKKKKERKRKPTDKTIKSTHQKLGRKSKESWWNGAVMSDGRNTEGRATSRNRTWRVPFQTDHLLSQQPPYSDHRTKTNIPARNLKHSTLPFTPLSSSLLLSPPLSSSSFPFTSPEGNVKSLHSGRMTSWEPPTDPLAADRGSPPATDAEKRGPQNPNMKQISRRWINESGRKERTIHTEKERNKRKSEWMRRRNSRCFFKWKRRSVLNDCVAYSKWKFSPLLISIFSRRRRRRRRRRWRAHLGRNLGNNSTFLEMRSSATGEARNIGIVRWWEMDSYRRHRRRPAEEEAAAAGCTEQVPTRKRPRIPVAVPEERRWRCPPFRCRRHRRRPPSLDHPVARQNKHTRYEWIAQWRQRWNGSTRSSPSPPPERGNKRHKPTNWRKLNHGNE